MRIKYFPKAWNEFVNKDIPHDTSIEYIDENFLRIDGKDYEFDPLSVEWPDILEQSGRMIRGVERDELGELWITMKRYYTKDPIWDTGEYHEIGR